MTYKQALALAYIIYRELYSEPKDSHEWANGFNVRHKIARVILANDK